MPTLFGKSVAAVACLALLVAHWHATKVDLKYGLSQLLHFAKDWVCGKGSGLSPMAARVEEAHWSKNHMTMYADDSHLRLGMQVNNLKTQVAVDDSSYHREILRRGSPLWTRSSIAPNIRLPAYLSAPGV
ncbi:hypothetical protein AK812_SmicGene38584 [Symbiodinium microadriaticum]|uniref:Reverse transcriptase domain-containing protein n=1 Tax=Symbiodinium microadriaticum TaxID=2951 RepID=A0A1Q9CDE3_SYMMI|nr:hypothetical protein AK812_SmicGene38584 [Symbiodinium microadriaticum]